MIKRYNLILFVVFFSLIACEKDDICIEGSENTNRINITFIDYSNKQPKSIDLNSIRGIGIDSIIEGISGTNLKLPLKVNSSKTKYLLEFNQDIDNDNDPSFVSSIFDIEVFPAPEGDESISIKFSTLEDAFI